MPASNPPIILTIGRSAMAVAIASVIPAAAQASPIQPWPDLFVNVPVARGWAVSGQVIGRIADGDRASQIETRLQIGRTLSRRVTAWVGWVHFANYLPDRRTGTEEQITEQVNWNVGTLGGALVSTRLRVQERFVGGVHGTSWRLAQQVRIAVPLGNPRMPSVVVSIEPYLALNRTPVQTHAIDQLRSFAGLAVPVSRTVTLEVGYLNQRLYRANVRIVNDAVPVTVSVRF